MKETIEEIIKEYLEIFPEEKESLELLKEYIRNYKYKEIIDWNNFNGHIVASGIMYSIKEKKYLVLYHKDFKKYLYPGGHVDQIDANPLETAKREAKEETNISDFTEIKISDNPLVPMDIDIHIAMYNERLNLPEHYHFDFRYLFVIPQIEDVQIDAEESRDYKWIEKDEFFQNPKYNKIMNKVEKLLAKLGE